MKKNKRIIGSKKVTALNHPLRIQILEWIEKGTNTVPQLTKVMNENRLNLYYHLKYLEDQGFISHKYSEKRIKIYSSIEQKSKIKSQEKGENAILINVEGKNRKKIIKKIREILKFRGIDVDNSYDFLQLQVVLQPKVIRKEREKLYKELKRN